MRLRSWLLVGGSVLGLLAGTGGVAQAQSCSVSSGASDVRILSGVSCVVGATGGDVAQSVDAATLNNNTATPITQFSIGNGGSLSVLTINSGAGVISAPLASNGYYGNAISVYSSGGMYSLGNLVNHGVVATLGNASGSAVSVSQTANLTIDNDGSIQMVGGTSSAIWMGNGTSGVGAGSLTVNNAVGAVISGGSNGDGISYAGNGSLNVVNSGTISGYEDAISVDSDANSGNTPTAVTISNTGTISGGIDVVAASGAVSIINGSSSPGVVGVISATTGDSSGVFVGDRNASLTPSYIGIVNYAGSTISAATGPAVGIDGALISGGTYTIQNSGTIQGGDDTEGTFHDAYKMAIVALSTTSQGVAIYNSGTIYGDVVMGSSGDVLHMQGGTIQGNVTHVTGQGNIQVDNSSVLTGGVYSETVLSQRLFMMPDTPLGITQMSNPYFGSITLNNGSTLTYNNSAGTLYASVDSSAAGTGTLNLASGTAVNYDVGATNALAAVNFQSGNNSLDSATYRVTNTTVAAGASLVFPADQTISGNLTSNGTIGLGSSVLTLSSLSAMSASSFTANAGSVIKTTVTGAGTTAGAGSTTLGRITASGAVTLASGVVVVPTVASGVSMVNGGRYVLASGGTTASVGTVTVTGSTGESWSVMRGDDLSLGQSGNDVYLIYQSGPSGSTAYSSAAQVVTPQVSGVASRLTASLVQAPVNNFLFSGAFGGGQGGQSGKDKTAMMGANSSLVRRETGIAAGDSGNAVAVWVNGGASRLSNSYASQRFDGYLGSLGMGVDYTMGDAVVGVALMNEISSLDTRFNAGNMVSRGVGLTPYVAYRITDNLGLSLMAGRTWLDYDANRSVGGYVTSDYQSYRDMAAATLSYTDTVDEWVWNVHGGYRWGKEHINGFIESDGSQVNTHVSQLGEASLGGRLARAFGTVEPYMGVVIMRDYVTTGVTGRFGEVMPTRGRNGVEGQLGATWQADDALSVGVDLSTSAFSNDVSTWGGMVNLRYSM